MRNNKINKENNTLNTLIASAFAMVNLSIKKNKLIPMYEQIIDDKHDNLFSIAMDIGFDYSGEIDMVEEIYQSLLVEYPEYGADDKGDSDEL